MVLVVLGKETLCYALAAEKLGYALLDEWGDYRVTALAALQRKTDLTNETDLAELLRHLDIQFIPQNGEVNIFSCRNGCEPFNSRKWQMLRQVAVFQKVRSALLQLQQILRKMMD